MGADAADLGGQRDEGGRRDGGGWRDEGGRRDGNGALGGDRAESVSSGDSYPARPRSQGALGRGRTGSLSCGDSYSAQRQFFSARPPPRGRLDRRVTPIGEADHCESEAVFTRAHHRPRPPLGLAFGAAVHLTAAGTSTESAPPHAEWVPERRKSQTRSPFATNRGRRRRCPGPGSGSQPRGGDDAPRESRHRRLHAGHRSFHGA
jgi:hypothetical protein